MSAGRRPFSFAVIAAVALFVAATGCSGSQLLRQTQQAHYAPPVPTDPMQLLPGEALFVSRLEAPQLFKGAAGNQVAQVIANLIPIGPESNFRPRRDVQRIYAAFYAMQGADFCAVLQGNFDQAAVAGAAARKAQTPAGTPLVHTRYGPYDLYTSNNLGFVVLSPHLILSGNETGLRRALDQQRYGRQQEPLAPWMQSFLVDPIPAYVVAGDVTGQGVIAAAEYRLPFVHGLETVRVKGNFGAPGMNMVGSLSYADETSAVRAVEGLESLRQLTSLLSLLTSWGLGGSAPELDAHNDGTNVPFATQVSASTVQLMVGLIVDATSPTAKKQTGWF